MGADCWNDAEKHIYYFLHFPMYPWSLKNSDKPVPKHDTLKHKHALLKVNSEVETTFRFSLETQSEFKASY